MSSYRNVFWRGAFALALLPVSVGLVAANGSEPDGAKATWCYELAIAKTAKAQELRVVAAQARAVQQEAMAEKITIRIQQAKDAHPQG